jgi:aminoglycoside phosphotransferase (APT) family kinase protein
LNGHPHFAVPLGSADASALQRSVSAAAMLDAFRRYLPPRDRTTWEACELARVRYVPGKSWHVLYRLWRTGQQRSDEPSWFHTEFLPPALALKRYLELRGRGTTSPTGFVAELDMLYWRFPADPQLEQLPAVHGDGGWRVVSYVPGKTCVLSGSYAGEPRILKLYGDERAERVGQVIEALREAGVTAPRVAAVEPARRFLVLEHVPGVLFWSDPVQHLRAEVVGAMAHELARLHATQPPQRTLGILPRTSHAALEWRRFQQATDELSQVFPDLEPRLQRLTTMLGPRSGESPAVLLHGSFHPAQFLIDRGRPRLMDFDAVCLGDPMYDLARFASHLYDMGQVNGQPIDRIEKAVSAFRSAYLSRAGERFDAGRWFWYLAVALVSKRAKQVLKRLEVDAEKLVQHLLNIAEQNAVSIARR